MFVVLIQCPQIIGQLSATHTPLSRIINDGETSCVGLSKSTGTNRCIDKPQNQFHYSYTITHQANRSQHVHTHTVNIEITGPWLIERAYKIFCPFDVDSFWAA